MEIWKDIEGYEGHYQVSNTGEVRSLPRAVEYVKGYTHRNDGRILEKVVLDNGVGKRYYIVSLSKDNKVKRYRIHRLVASAFIPNPENKPQVNHIDGNKFNNNVENLEWVTVRENKLHAVYTGLDIPTYGIKPVRCLNNGKTYRSASEAARQLGLNDSSVAHVCRGEWHHTKGMRFEYV